MSADNMIVIAHFANGYFVAETSITFYEEIYGYDSQGLPYYTEEASRALLWKVFRDSPIFGSLSEAEDYVYSESGLDTHNKYYEGGVCHRAYTFPLEPYPILFEWDSPEGALETIADYLAKFTDGKIDPEDIIELFTIED